MLAEKLKSKFEGQQARLKVAKAIIENGLRIGGDGKIYCGKFEIPHSKIAKALGVDRRTVKATVDTIMSDELLSGIFTRIKPAGPLMKDIAIHLGYSCIEIYVKDPSKPGIVSKITELLAGYGVSIRQVIADDPQLISNPKLTIITDGRIPGHIMDRVSAIEGIEKVIVY